MHSGFKRAAALLCALVLAVVALPAAADANPFHVLLIGVDTQEEEQAGRSDVMLLISLSPEDGSVRMLSFLRDLYVAIPGHGHSRLNAAYFYGGERLLRDTRKAPSACALTGTPPSIFPLWRSSWIWRAA